MAAKKRGFEEAMLELETLVENLENGKLSLEEQLATYEKGMQLSQEIEEVLAAGEARVRKLSGNREVDIEEEVGI